MTPEIIRTARVVLRAPNDSIFGFIRPLSSKQRAGDIDFAGGTVERGEHPLAAAIRESREEIGVELTGPFSYLYGVSELDGNVWISREYHLSEERIEPKAIQTLTEHIGMVCASKATFLSLTECQAHQQAAALVS